MKKEREYAKTEEGRENLAFKAGFTSTVSGSWNRDTKADCWSAESVTVSKEGDKEAFLTSTKSTKVEEAVAGKEALSMDAEGGFVMCEVEEQVSGTRSSAALEKKSGDTCGIGRIARLRHGSA